MSRITKALKDSMGSIMLVRPETQQSYFLNLTTLSEELSLLTDEERFELKAQESRGYWDFPSDSVVSNLRPYSVHNGTLTIPVRGSLLNNFPFAWGEHATGYEYIQEAYTRGMGDPVVKRIEFRINSPGGVAEGNFDLVDFIASNKVKPLWSIVEGGAYSAAYNIAAAADKVYLSRSSGVGSIGVVLAHFDMSEYLKKEGLDVTFIYAGKHKIDNSPYKPLSEEAKTRAQKWVDELHDIFVKSVAKNRGMSEQEVRATEALTYGASEGVMIGLADAVMTFSKARAAFEGDSAHSTTAGVNMSKQNENFAATSEASPSSEHKDDGLINQATTVDLNTQLERARKEGAETERERIRGILALDEAQTRKATASQLAMNTDLSVEVVKGILASVPEEFKAKADVSTFKTFLTAMEQGNPEISGGDERDDELDEAAAIIASYRHAQGH